MRLSDKCRDRLVESGLFTGGIDTTATYHIVDALLTGFVPTPPVEIPAHADGNHLLNLFRGYFTIVPGIAVPVLAFYLVIVDKGLKVRRYLQPLL